MTSSRRHALLLGIALLAVTACGGADGNGSAATGTSGPAAVVSALDFTAPLVGGGTFDGAELSGRPVAFWFWAPT